MKFDDNYFCNEIRNNFFVGSMMKRAWAAQIEIMVVFDRICRENNLKYYAFYGTLLGAVRHKGFIPWDDDIDVCMMREDLEIFRSIIINQMPSGYLYKSMHTYEESYYPFDRLLNSDSINLRPDFLKQYHGFPFAAGIDIFPLDYLPSEEKRGEFNEDLYTLIEIIGAFEEDETTILNDRMIELIEIKYGYKIEKNKNQRNQLWKLFEKESVKYGKSKGEDVTIVFEWVNNASYQFKKSWFDETEQLQFENITLPCPKKWDEVLRVQYNNYMDIKMAYEELHSYPFYNKQEPALYEKINMSLLSYLDKSQGKNVNDSVIENPQKDILNRMELLKKINEYVVIMIQDGDKNEALDLLSKMQEIAIGIGGVLENRYSENDIVEIIKELEIYCENAYQLSQMVEADSREYITKASEMVISWGAIKEMVIKLPEPRKKILFMIKDENDWNHYKKIFEILDKENDMKCLVMPVPYYIRNSVLSVDVNREIYNGEEIGKKTDIIDYRSFDFISERVDCVIKSDPFDKQSFGEVINSFFHTGNLKKYCKKVIHIPTLDIMDFTMDNTQMVFMANYFALTPGVTEADYVYLNSKTNRDTYICLLKKGNIQTDWEDRIRFSSDFSELVEDIREML